MASAHLEVLGPRGTTEVPLNQSPLTIGRHADNALALSDDLASRFHCVIEPVPGGFRLKDLQSRNGTRLNGMPIRETMLQHGDVVRIGRHDLRLVVPEDEPEPEEAPIDTSDPLRALQQMAQSLPEKEFAESDIALMNARGKLAHAALPSEAAGSARRKAAAPAETGGEAIRLLRALLLLCFRIRATDIHIEPKNDGVLVRIRVDGNMVEVARLNSEQGVRLSSAIKVLSDIDIGQRNIVQEGHFSARVPGRRVDYRVSYAPAMFGQKAVIRILDAASAPFYIWDLQMPPYVQRDIEKAVQGDNGMVLVCGPTGSGKTTTLYACVRSIDSGERNVVTIEDPVEIQIEGVTQIPVNEQQGNTFAALLRSILRQDPDAILVGEVRDAETARIAMQAAMTGHLVFSTIHARDTVSTVFRLLDLGIEPFLVGSALHHVIAQRLVRQLCPRCKRAVKPTAEQMEKLGPIAGKVERVYEPGKCMRCLQTGYYGRRALFELLTVDDNLRDVILRGGTMQDILQSVDRNKFVKLQHSGYQIVAEGLTSFDEVERTVG